LEKKVSFIGKVFVAIMILFVLGAPLMSSAHAIYYSASSIPPTTVFLSPYRVNGTQGETVTVNLNVSDITNFLTGQAGLIWTNTAAVNCTNIAMGSFMTPVSKTSFIEGGINETTGFVQASLFSFLGNSNAKNGSGAFLTFTFYMIQTGYSDLYINDMFLTAKGGVTLIPVNTIDYFTVVRAGKQYPVEIMGNPSWSNTNFGGYYNGSVTAVSQKIGSTTYAGQLSFNINSTADDFGSFAYFNVTIPNKLMNCSNPDEWQIELNGGSAVAPTEVTVGATTTTISLVFSYTEAPQTAEIFSTSIAVPEFSNVFFATLLILATFIMVLFGTVWSRKRKV